MIFAKRAPLVRKIALFYGHVASNIGDLAINRGAIAFLQAAYPEANITIVLMDARKSQHLSLAMPSLERGEKVQVVHFKTSKRKALLFLANPAEFLNVCQVADADLVVMNAGEHLFQYSHSPNDRNLFWRLFPVLAGKMAHKACMMLPATFGPYEDGVSAAVVQASLAVSDLAAARERGSQSLLGEAYPLLLDPAFFLPEPAGVQRTSSRRVIGLALRSEGMGIRLPAALRDQRTSEFKEKGYASSQSFQFAKALGELLLKDANTDVRIMVQTVADQPLAEHIKEALDKLVGDGSRVSMYRPDSIENYMAEIAALDGLVASRFHALIFAMVAKTPCFGLYFEVHGHKIPGLYEMLGHPQHCLNLTQLPAQMVAQQVNDWLHTAGQSNKALLKEVASLQKETRQWAQSLSLKDSGEEMLELYRHLTVYATRLFEQVMAGAAATQTKEIADKYEALLESDAYKHGELEGAMQQRDAARRKLQEEGDQGVAASEFKALQEKEKELLKAREELTALEAKFSALQGRLNGTLAKQEAENAAMEARLRELESKCKGLEIARANAQAEIFKAERAIKSQLSYRLGSVIVSEGMNPLRWPVTFLKLMRTRHVFYNPHLEESAENRFNMAALTAVYKKGGAKSLTAEVRKQVKKLSAKEQALALLMVGKAMDASAFPKAEMELAHAALKLEKSEAVLKGFFWAAQRAGQLQDACNAILQIEAKIGNSTNAAVQKRLTQLRKQPSYQLSLLPQIPAKAVRQLEPVKGRVCYILHNAFPFSSGGYATRSHGVASGLKANGADVIVITRPGFPVDVVDGLDAAQVTTEDTIDGIRYTRILKPTVKGMALVDYLLKAADALEEKFREHRPEYVIAASNYRVGIAALIAARRLGIPFAYEVRGWWEITRMSRDADFEKSTSYLIQKMMESEVAQRADHVFTLTQPMCEELVERGIVPEKITLLPNSCDSTRFLPRERDVALAAQLGIPADVPVIGYIGTFVDYEGLEDLALACGVLKSKGIAFRLLMVGNENTSGAGAGPITSAIKQAAEQEGFKNWLIMPGRVPHDAVESYYSLIDIAPFPRKPWPVCEMVSPMKPLEALAMEKAVVVSDVRALAEMIQNGITGATYAKGSVSALADALASLIENPALRQQMGKQGRKWVESERTWVKTAQTLKSTLAKL